MSFFNPENLQDILKQAQTMQKNITDAQGKLKQQEFKGKAGGDWVEFVIDGAHVGLSVTIHPDAMKEPADVLADLILAAYNKAHEGVENFTKGELGKLMQGVQLPDELRGLTGE